MTFPDAAAYQEAVLYPDAAFTDPALRSATPELLTWGLPRVITGARAAVFPMHTRTGRVAVRCFLAGSPDLRARYRAVAAHLRVHPHPALLDVDYQPRGLRLDGQMLPLVTMPWAEGRPLNTFVAEHLGEARLLEALAEAWLDLLAGLARAGIAHGDLQHGNVLVALDGRTPRLTLVDYDTLYVPALKSRPHPEFGHRNYQHPDRRPRDPGATLDRFSGWVILTALRACAADPSLWERFDTGENLLFTAADFHDPDGSPLFAALAALPGLTDTVALLRRACLTPPEAVPPPGLAAPPSPPPRRRASHRRVPALPLLAGGAVVLAAVATATPLPALAGLLGGGALLFRSHARHPLVRRRRSLTRDLRLLSERLARMAREEARLEDTRQALLDSHDARRAERLQALREAALHDRLKYHFTDEVGAFEGLGHRVVVRLKAAGIRNAYMATPDHLSRVTGLGPQRLAGVARWRAMLVDRYHTDLPEALGPAECRRLDRALQHRLSALDDERARLRNRRTLQEAEREALAHRLAGLPRLSFPHYVAACLSLRPLPSEPVRD